VAEQLRETERQRGRDADLPSKRERERAPFEKEEHLKLYNLFLAQREGKLTSVLSRVIWETFLG